MGAVVDSEQIALAIRRIRTELSFIRSDRAMGGPARDERYKALQEELWRLKGRLESTSTSPTES